MTAEHPIFVMQTVKTYVPNWERLVSTVQTNEVPATSIEEITSTQLLLLASKEMLLSETVMTPGLNPEPVTVTLEPGIPPGGDTDTNAGKGM